MVRKTKKRQGLVAPAIALSALAFAAPASALPTCSELGTWLAAQPKVSEILSVGLTGNRCELLFAVSGRGGTENGYAPGQQQRNVIRVGLPSNLKDGGSGNVGGNWNGKIQHIGGGGLVGTAPAVTGATDAGYAGASTDSGHTSAENGAYGNWGVIQATKELNLGKINDFVYQSLIDQVEWTRWLVVRYYEMDPQRTYWNGFSTGGRQGLSLALTMGDQFDGFLVGAPAIYHQQFRLADAHTHLIVRKLHLMGQSLTAEQRNAANAAARDACTGNVDVNGNMLADGVLYDPRTCTFDASKNICGMPNAPAAPSCLTQGQADAMNMAWDGPRNSYGKRIWVPYDRGINGLFGVTSAAGNPPEIPGSAAQVIKWNHKDLTFDHNLVFLDRKAIDLAGNPPGAMTYEDEATLGSQQVADFSDIIDVALTKAKGAGAKILMYHGLQDNLIRWRHTLDYYTRAAAYFANGTPNYEVLRPWFRFYMVPEAGHSANAVPNRFDALVDWVEKGVEPAPLVNLSAGRTRPLCAYPQRIIYDGVGDPNVAGSFFCGGDTRTKQTICDGVRTVYKHENENMTQSYGKYNEAACNPNSRVPLP
jgi:hypothetical protein